MNEKLTLENRVSTLEIKLQEIEQKMNTLLGMHGENVSNVPLNASELKHPPTSQDDQ